ncbi:hypothetical protein P691DRAFT_724329 [Macrolepiota fuliginosa MF-IS2]|uniref:Protein kinase domain-containing protein n=1 Tax=Macrolepiota fuliginosa MF-IS2 TaxID=1400762 RepID=A0A9P5XLG8_9AGAR|nr:hypothetical protein P691DRAFT_724329 [Macrolepiota fuliginosa MF-IS2]
MASSSGAASGSNGYPKSSRFSTLKMFKFNGKEKAPPPPPKDPYYLPNRSMTSLSPDSLSIPPQSPISPQYLTQYPHRRSPAPSQSTMSLVSSTASQLSGPLTDQAAPKKKKSMSFLKFGKRSKSSTREPDAGYSLPPEEDENISWPSNFQHNIHVDDALSGLPPSWSKSLADMGFTEEEIANLNARRAANSRAIQQLYNSRPESPSIPPQFQSLSNDRSASPTLVQPSNNSPVLTNPLPRSTSLARKYSNTSIRGRSSPSTNVAVPILTTSSSSTSLHSIRTNNTNISSGHPPVPPRSNTTPSLHNPSLSIVTMSSDSHLSYQSAGLDSPAVPPAVPNAVPSTPTRRLHVANPNTPPPAYSVPRITTNITHQEAKSNSSISSTISGPTTGSVMTPTASLPVPPSTHRSQASVESNTSSPTTTSTRAPSPPSTPQLQRQQSGSLSRPPRLSLHASSGSDDWSKLVLSASSLLSEEKTGSRPSTSQKAQTKPPAPPARPIPPIIVPGEDDAVGVDSASPPPTGWAEAATTARPSPSSAASSPPTSGASWQEFRSELEDFVEKDGFKEAPLSAALTGSHSPILPDSFPRSRQRDTLRAGPDGTLLMPPQERYMQQEGSDEDYEDDEYLGVRRSNRDSGRSTTSTLSTSTVTGYTYSTPQIIRNASIVRRTGAYVTTVPVSPSRKKEQQQKPLSSSSPSSWSPPSPAPVQVVTEEASPVENPPLSPMGVAFQVNMEPISSAGSRRQSGAPSSPMNSQFGSDESGGSASTTSSSSQSQDHPTPTTDPGSGGGIGDISLGASVEMDLASYYTNTPSPSMSTFSAAQQKAPPSPRDTFGNAPKVSGVAKVVSGNVDVDVDDSFVDLDGNDGEYEGQASDEEDEEGTWDTLKGNAAVVAFGGAGAARPAIIISDESASPPPEPSVKHTAKGASSSLPPTPLTPAQRYPGWLSGVVKPLSPFIDEAIEPRDHYADLQEIAEGESGSIFAARLVRMNVEKLRLPSEVRKRDTTELRKDEPVLVAIKIIAIAPPSSTQGKTPEAQKLVDLERELKLMKGLWHENVLGLDALYVDLTEDTLWVRMELMERSLADIVGLVVDGLMLQDRMIARFARDVLHALAFLQENRIAHRDVRSDNLLLNSHGLLKLTDFSNAVRLPPESSLRSDSAGVIFWQAPEMRYPNYDALKVDVWSLGATMWEMAETEPPFSDTKQVQSRWPSLTRPEMWSPAFHSFLRACSDSAVIRKTPTELLKDPFVSNACGRGVIVQLLTQCMNIERMIQGANDS